MYADVRSLLILLNRLNVIDVKHYPHSAMVHDFIIRRDPYLLATGY